ncbi:carbohydrate kinase family protein [Bradyrhizobium sp. Ai1a-2]|uniref:carbohydrate kinase family protein n=1 Tax=Bradyrhizobium sp. Ai1a-2 TaxID=196490 RepID=UPI0004174DCA|nr:carbohydrate kinase family protein [Bradyrhizobium sp. Ai1a-2]
MIVTGGLYREICECPPWDAVYGSGGRAAAAIANLSASVELHTYSPFSRQMTAQLYGQPRVRLQLTPSNAQIVFAYLHPLSRPSVAPTELRQHSPIHVQGDAVVRFGFLEGEAIVVANRAVYDPQTSARPARFRENGSQANELALVLNEQELRTLGQTSDIILAARNLLESEGAAFIAAKRGVNGCAVFHRDGRIDHVPAYRSQNVFKIGTGDVFTATLSYHWAKEGRAPTDAANLASRAVASYAQTKELPDAVSVLTDLSPVAPNRSAKVIIVGSIEALQDRWLLEEARWCIRELGLTAICPDLGEEPESHDLAATAALFLARDNESFERRAEALVSNHSLPAVVFSDRALSVGSAAEQIDDFVTAIYRVCWLALEAQAAQ